MQTNYVYYQYHKDMSFPVYIRLKQGQLEKSISATLDQLGFTVLKGSVSEDEILKDTNARMLELESASAQMAKRMMSSQLVEETLGNESISERSGYKYYSYRGFFAMVFSVQIPRWEGKIIFKSGAADSQFKLRTVLYRFLTFALSPFNVLGLWGVPVDDGIVVMNQSQSNAEALFFDLDNLRMFSMDGSSEIEGLLQIIRLDNTLKNRSKNMESEELISFLMTRTTALNVYGISQRTKQAIVELSKLSCGTIYPEENYRPRMNLSYER